MTFIIFFAIDVRCEFILHFEALGASERVESMQPLDFRLPINLKSYFIPIGYHFGTIIAQSYGSF
jgi:hypothetical protein